MYFSNNKANAVNNVENCLQKALKENAVSDVTLKNFRINIGFVYIFFKFPITLGPWTVCVLILSVENYSINSNCTLPTMRIPNLEDNYE